MSERHIDVYRGFDMRWRWRVVAANGQKMGSGGQAFYSKWNATRGAVNVNPELPVFVNGLRQQLAKSLRRR